MTPKKQVSPAIRILRGEGDASARATHLEAATRKFLVTTNERKQMSTKTNFKRIALVAVAALGLGVLSSVPSQATVTGLTVTTVNGTTTLGASLDTTTAAVVAVSGLGTAGAGDSISVTFIAKGTLPAPTAVARMAFVDTATGNASSVTRVMDTVAGSIAALGTQNAETVTTTMAVSDSITAGGAAFGVITPSAASYMGARFEVQLESTTVSRGTTGVYNYTAIVTSYFAGAVVATATADFSITIAALASESLTIAPGSSTAFMGITTGATSDAVISALATASTTPVAYVRVVTKNANGDAKPESITATISGAGILSFGGISGTSLTVAGTGGSDISVLPDGRAGTATITISTPTRSFPSKTMTFYAVAPATLVATVSAPLAVVGTNSDVVRVTATDSAGVSWNGTLYIYASSATDAAIAGAVRATAASSAIACAVPTATQPAHVCPVSGIAAGTAKFKVSNYATAALATAAASGAEVTSNEVSVVVSIATVATVKIEFDKASYAPGERARIYVTPLDSTGKALPAGTYSNLFASGGISTASALTFAGSTTTADSLTAVSITTSATSSSSSGARAGSMQYTVYMPVSGATVTLSATGGTSLPIAGRVAVTGTATVSDSGAAALAAVTALATTVASLKTLITTLTNLVLKIQKKVKA